MIKAMIVEDSRLARLELSEQLKAIDYIEKVAEADNIASAIELYQQQPIDLVLLDIDLPDGTGFDFLAALEHAPKVIFTTAFADFALQAFEQNAVDYLLKPYTQQRLEQACQRLELQQQNSKSHLDSPFFVKDGDHCWLIKPSQVERFEAIGNYTRVYFNDEKPMVYRSLSQIESKLNQAKFFRANRQNIIQLSYITAVTRSDTGALEISLVSGATVTISRRQAVLFKERYAL